MLKQKYIRDKNFLLLFFGSLVSGTGSRIYGFGISLFLLDLTGLAKSISVYVSIWTFTIFILSPIAATFTDRWKRKVRVLYITDYGRGIVYLISAAGVYYFTSIDNMDMVLTTIYTLLVFIAIQSAFFSPASSALIPQIVPEDELVSAGSLFQLTRSVQNVAGMAIGAFLYVQFGIVMLIVINAISFLFSAFSEMFIKYEQAQNQDRLNHSAYEDEEVGKNKVAHYGRRVYNDLKEATVYIVRDAKPILAIVLIIVVSLTMVEPYFTIGVPYLIKEYLSFESIKPDYILALSESAVSIGMIIMSILVAVYIASKLNIHQLLKTAGITYMVIVVGYFLTMRLYDYNIIEEHTFLIFFIGINFVAGLTSALFNAPLNASIQKYVDPNKIGKVVTIMDSTGGILMPFAILLSGFIIDNVSVYYVMYTMMAGIVIMTGIIFFNKHIKELN